MVSLAVVLAVAYWPYIYGPATSPRWALLAVSLPILLVWYYRKVNFTLIHLLGLLFIVWSILSLAWTSNLYDGIDNLIKWIILAEVFVLGSFLPDLNRVFLGLGIGISVSSVLLLCGFQTGLFSNVNVLAEAALMVCVGAVVYKIWWLVPGLLPAIVLNGSRGAILSGVALLSLCTWNRFKSFRLEFALIALCLSLAFVWYWHKPFGLTDRLVLWSDTYSGLTMIGHGLGSFFTSYPALTDSFDTLLVRPRFAHNDFLQVLFDLGLVGGVLISLFCLCAMSVEANERYIFGAFLLISCISFPLYLPVSSFIAAIVAGYLASRWNGLYLSFANGRMVLCKWYENFRARKQLNTIKKIG